MGKRNLNSTKSGRFINPTDQSRKEARRKELKKNKKQRMAVRAAVLKSKDPAQLLEEAAAIDRQEYDPNVASALNERVLQEKRRRLIDTFDRLIHMYSKEDPNKYRDLMRSRTAYDKRRTDLMLYSEQVKLAQRVKANDIPLPDLPPVPGGTPGIQAPGFGTKSVMKIPNASTTISASSSVKGKKPPGPPPGPPAELSDSDPEDDTFIRSMRYQETTGLLPPVGISAVNFQTLNQIPLPNPGLNSSGFSMHGMHFINDQLHPHLQKPTINYQNNTSLVNMPRNLPPQNKNILQSGTNSNVASAGQQTIEAKPKLKNLIADATRLVPTALKVRRTVKDAKGRTATYGGVYHEVSHLINPPSVSKFGLGGQVRSQQKLINKDDAYEEFMKEMENIL